MFAEIRIHEITIRETEEKQENKTRKKKTIRVWYLHQENKQIP